MAIRCWRLQMHDDTIPVIVIVLICILLMFMLAEDMK